MNQDSSDDENAGDQKSGINAELEALRSSGKSSNDVTKAVVDEAASNLSRRLSVGPYQPSVSGGFGPRKDALLTNRLRDITVVSVAEIGRAHV